MSTTGASTDGNKSCRNVIIGFCIVGCIGFIIIISLFIWNFGFRYKNNGPITPVQCQQENGANLQDFCYVPSSDQLPWQQAEAKCVKSSGHLASIPSDVVNTGVLTQVFKFWPNSTDAWIGLNDMGTVGDYRYSDGDNVTYTNFANSTLALSPTQAAALRCFSISAGKNLALDGASSGQWVKHDCTTAYAYICRYALATAPFPPTQVSASQISGGARISFLSPAQDGGKPVDNYTVTSWPDLVNVTAKSSPIDVKGLRPYVWYNFTVVATNVVGSSAPSDPTAPILPGVTNPDPPTNVVALPGDTTVTISFTPPKSDGGAALTSYVVTGPGSVVQTFNLSQVVGNSVTFSGLTNGQSANLQIQSVNNASLKSVLVPVTATPQASIPSRPLNLVATAGYRNVSLTWTVGTGTVPSSYSVYGSYWLGEIGESQMVTLNALNTTSTSLVATGLIIDIQYTFYVVALDATGASPPSVTYSATPYGLPPFAPQNVVAAAAGRAVSITFSPPDDDGGYPILNFTARANDTTVPPVTLVLTEPPTNTSTYNITVPNLIANSVYSFTVTASSQKGVGLTSAPTANILIAGGNPDPPINVTATATGQGAFVTWALSGAPGFDGGFPIRNFSVIATAASGASTRFASSNSTPQTNFYVGLLMVNINYTFTVVAINDAGSSQPSLASNPVVPWPVVPTAPQSVVASAGPQSANVTWQAPSNTGGVAITGYTVLSNPAAVTVNVSVNVSTPLYAIVPHLWDITQTYTFQVSATNEVGTGPAATSAGITVNANRPDPPVNVHVKASFSGADVSFQSPANDGGSKITYYSAISQPATQTINGSSSPLTFKSLDSTTNYTFTVYAVNSIGISDPSLPSESFRRDTSQIIKDLAIPIAGGIILGLLVIVGIIIGVIVCKNNEKCCWAREGGSTTKDKAVTATTSVDMEEAPKTEPIGLGQSSSGYVETETSKQEKDPSQEV